VRIRFCGVRGSSPAPGPEYLRYGGNTSCVSLAHGDGPPTLALDAGTGLVNLSAQLQGEPFRGTLLVGHLHWDHTHGLPFFGAGDREASEVRFVMPAQGDPVAVLSRMMSPPHFPIGPRELEGTWRFDGLEPGEHEIEGFSVVAAEIPHKGGRTFGYRISDGTATIAYLSDHCPLAIDAGPDGEGARHSVALELCDGVDLLIHDAQFRSEERDIALLYGHSTVAYAVALAEESGARRVALFHHNPFRSDDDVDDMLAKAQATAPPDLEVMAAAEGIELVL
jgi:phosphoribosyl 1,2-cyclic phosphodiesterase